MSLRLQVIFQDSFQVGVEKTLSQNVSDLMLKILLPLVIGKPLVCLL